ncbi:MAG: FMN-binding protein [Deltaproteobacteria bacterium]|nr:FMN-binding protein [Deltaproteobacteria bacterium]
MNKGMGKALLVTIIIATVCALGLAFTEKMLRKRIIDNQALAESKSLLKVLGFKDVKPSEINDIMKNSVKKIQFGTSFYHKATNVQGKIILAFPMKGKGLWGPINGYISTDETRRTIVDLIITRQEETPGLGAEIESESFYSQFRGRKIFADDNPSVVKISVAPGRRSSGEYEVDGISGATETCKGVNNMIRNTLTKAMEYSHVQN